MRPYHVTIAAVFLAIPACLPQFCCTPDTYPRTPQSATAATPRLELIRPAPDGTRFVGAESGATFIPWGFNYDHDADGRLLEDYWFQRWPTVVHDFGEMKALGANVVRIHLQTAKFMNTPSEPNQVALNQLARLLKLAAKTGLYLDITGLGCYHKAELPRWYDSMSEAARWDVQALFWEAVAATCAHSPAVFCYDLMNEPVLPGADKPEKEWLVGEFAGKNFVQRITLDLAGRTRQNVAKDWVERLVAAIRKHDRRHMITVGVIPWAYTFPGARPLFYSHTVAAKLDFVSVHFYPEKGMLDKALNALAVYDIGKPLVVEEMFPLKCGTDELDAFIDASARIADGWIGFYWGKTIEEYSKPDIDLPGAITRDWLKYFKAKTPDILHLRSELDGL
ncbi:MAG: cellulase family glycosylhydrolase [Phycisphaerales bacterium]|nr:MAG: cellulase family glycosylhydrolase [Phycisphaerales bacterium]